jgi:PAS domain S-box-containing protein
MMERSERTLPDERGPASLRGPAARPAPSAGGGALRVDTVSRAVEILERVADSFVLLDDECRILMLNAAAERVYGRPRQALVGLTQWEAWPSAAGGEIERQCHRVLRERVEVHFLYHDLVPGARDAWLEIDGYPSDGGIALFYRDVTARCRAEDALREAHRRLEFHADNSPLAVIEWDSALRVTRWSREAERVFGWTAEEVRGRTIEEIGLVFDADLVTVERETEQMMLEHATRHISRNRNWTKDGRVVRCEWYNSALREPDGTLISIYSEVLDVTEARRAEEALRASERRLRLLAEASRALAATLDTSELLRTLARLPVPELADYVIVYRLGADGRAHRVALAHADPSKLHVLQELERRYALPIDSDVPAARALRTNSAVLIAEMTAEALRGVAPDEAYMALVAQLAPTSGIVVTLAARGRALGAMVLAYSEASQRHYNEEDLQTAGALAERAALALDTTLLLTEAREARDEAHRAQGAAEKANKAKSDFLAVMSHELRTPINAVLGYAALLADGVTGPVSEAQRGQLSRIQASARHLLALIEDVLSLSRIEASQERIHPEPVDVVQMADEVAAFLEPSATTRGIAVRREGDTIFGAAGRAVVETDPTKVRQILLNLASNAVKFTERGAVTLTVRSTGDGVDVTVADTGMGIAPEHHERVFEPFWQVDQRRNRAIGGTGLGLGVSRRLARLLGGDVTLSSALGKGTSFTLRLPLALPAGTPIGY